MLNKVLAWFADSGLLLALCLLTFLAGYVRGDHVTSLDYEFRIASLKADWTEREQAHAEAVAVSVWRRPRRGVRSSPASSPRKSPIWTRSARP